eukprot:TRINITY_DN11048_c0_g3_i1.p1 TRINITY_DN11048_c0_g3~~TRINITY_DN11048_c0_g3_i1.p1  ORF type:complete len:666 (-),score=76.16 TRINITY_DN11048_c0_g3_i1:365-2362(-)
MAPTSDAEADANLSNTSHPFTWAVISACVFAVAFLACAPTPCEQVSECETEFRGRPRQFNSIASWVLLIMLIHELASLLRTWRGSREVTKLVDQLRSRALPSLLLSVNFAVLSMEQFHHAIPDGLFVHASPKLTVAHLGGFDLDIAGRPVYTAMFLEWLITVPTLLALSGYCALGRPLQEMAVPIVATNIYIVFCWSALLVGSLTLRWSLIGVSLGMYVWVSGLMMKWVSNFLDTAPKDLPCRAIRPYLTEGLISLFFVYGILFVLTATGSITCEAESKIFSFLNVGSKVAMSIAFVVIREDEYHESLANVLNKVSLANLGMISILRGNFDVILPCRATSCGDFCLPLQRTADMKKLEALLGRSVAGASLVELVAGQRGKDDFTSYIRNTLSQANSERALDSARLSSYGFWHSAGKDVSPPVAQVVNCRLLRAKGASSSSATHANDAVETIGACIYTSVVPEAAISFNNDRWLTVAIQLSFGEEACEESEHAVVGDVERLAAFNASESFKQDYDDSASCGASTMAQSRKSSNFVGNLADLALMGIDILSSHLSTTESDASSSKKDALTNSQQSTVDSETVVSAMRVRTKTSKVFDPGADPSPGGSDVESHLMSPRAPSPTTCQKKCTREKDMPRVPTWAHDALVASTAVATVLGATAALRLCFRK